MTIVDPDKKDEQCVAEEKEKKKRLNFDLDAIPAVIESLRLAMLGNDEDVDQEALVKTVQSSRAFLLEYALQAYLDNPKNPGLLEGVSQIIAQIEKTVRDDRKERSKKKEGEGNRVAFNQMLEALQGISKGAVNLPTFEFTQFILDPSIPLVNEALLKSPIRPDELVQGIVLANIDGEKMDLVQLPPDKDDKK